MGGAEQEEVLVDRLRSGDEEAFRQLVLRHHTSMIRLAETFVPSRAVAEEVAQEAWLAVIKGIGRFEGRSSLSTWIYRIVANIGRTRGERERRTVPTANLSEELSESTPSVPVDRFSGPDGHGRWAQGPARWSDLPDQQVSGQGTLDTVTQIAAGLSENQRRVFVLRDIEGLSSAEVCSLLELSEGNQRVLLHRARSQIRAHLEHDLGERS